jgi:iron-sulfur cluster assembly protein
MIRVDVTPQAARQVRAMLAGRQDDLRYGLRVAVDTTVTSGQPYRLSLSPTPQADELVLPRHGFDVYVHRSSGRELDGVRIDFVDSGSLAGFTIDRVPRPRTATGMPPFGTGGPDEKIGEILAGAAAGVPAGPADLVGRVEAALDTIRPVLTRDGGDVSLVAVRDDVAYVRLSGACSGCSAATQTLRSVVQRAIGAAVPQITDAVLVP